MPVTRRLQQRVFEQGAAGAGVARVAVAEALRDPRAAERRLALGGGGDRGGGGGRRGAGGAAGEPAAAEQRAREAVLEHGRELELQVLADARRAVDVLGRERGPERG